MVVPIELSDTEVRGAIEAARKVRAWASVPGIHSEEKPQVLIVPRIGTRGLAPSGPWPSLSRLGRLPGGERAR